MEINFPKKYKKLDIESKWTEQWDNQTIYHYDPSISRENTFIVDTPPPTVSGDLHMGHVFSYTQTDVIVRYQRMNGKNIFYPIGWDNNGLPTERRVQNIYKITCDPSLAYEPMDFTTQNSKKTPMKPVSRQNFTEACRQLTTEDQKKYRALWKRVGLSFDWRYEYTSMDPSSIKTSQYSFLQLVKKGVVSSKQAPSMWDSTFQTAVALAEIEEKEETTQYHDIEFKTDNGTSLVISTTRPELLPACIAIAVNPDDERYQHLIGTDAISPLFYARIPIIGSNTVNHEKGTGVMMVCTFGDGNDVIFWKKHQLPLKQIISKQGTILNLTFGEAPFDSDKPDTANQHYQTIASLPIKKARKEIVALLSEAGSEINGNNSALKGSIETVHNVRLYEKGERPIEYIPTRQWFINVLDHKQDLLAQGQKVQWHPASMRKRYELWVEGLDQDWCISRQRFFGVPFPVWYPLDEQGNTLYDQPIFADEATLPVDPQTVTPVEYDKTQRNQPGGFTADPDVMDTWATSSLTPQLATQWPTQHHNLYPATLRTQAHEIIRTWAFYTIVKSWFHEKSIPWENIAISGWVVNPDRSKMSKSKGNTVTPGDLLNTYSTDAIRYWAAKAKLGQDTIFDENVFHVGQKCVVKLFNASKFVLMQIQDQPHDLSTWLSPQRITEVIDLAWIKKCEQVIEEATTAFKNYDYTQALQATENLFWDFCDNYLELVKTRAYQQKETDAGQSAITTLLISLRVFLRLFAPIMPFITEEIWSWCFGPQSQESSIHTASWPHSDELASVGQDPELIDLATEILRCARTTKTQAQKGMKWPISCCEIALPSEQHAALESVKADLCLACSIAPENCTLSDTAGELQINITLAETNEA